MRLTPAFEVKRASVDEAGLFSGYASAFGGGPDSHGDVIIPGAYAKSLEKHKAEGSTPAMLWSHDSRPPIGAWKELVEDDMGLRVTGQLTLELEKAREAYALMKTGALGLSIGYELPHGYTRNFEEDVRELHEIDLHEVSVCSIPSNRRARIREVKSVREYETALRDELGFSFRQAKKLAAGGWAALQGRDGSDELDELILRDLQNKSRELSNLIMRIR